MKKTIIVFGTTLLLVFAGVLIVNKENTCNAHASEVAAATNQALPKSNEMKSKESMWQEKVKSAGNNNQTMNLDEIEKYRIGYRELIVSEQSQINQKLMRLFQIQSFLFAGYVVLFSINKSQENKSHNFSESERHFDTGPFKAVIAFIGLSTSLLILSSLFASSKAFRIINDGWSKIIKPDKYPGPGIFGIAPDFNTFKVLTYLSAENIIVIIFIFIWLILFITHFKNFSKKLKIIILSALGAIIVGVIIYWLVIRL